MGKKRKIKGAPLQDLSHSLRKVDYLLIRLNPSLLTLDNKPGEHFSNSSSIAVRHALRSTGTCELHVYRTRFSLISGAAAGRAFAPGRFTLVQCRCRAKIFKFF